MQYSHIQNSNLNLLVAFQSLIEERNISRAGARVNLSQSAMSRVFDRLQHMFGDELLVRTRNGYEPTHRAIQIHADLDQLLPRLEALLNMIEFNPAEATEFFRIAATNSSAFVFIPRLLELMMRSAPKIQMEMASADEDVFQKVEDNTVDLVLWVNEAPSNLRRETLLKDKLVCLLRTEHPLGKRPLTLQRYLKQKHLALTVGGQREGVVDTVLATLGHRRNVQMKLLHSIALPPILERTDLIATLPKLAAELLVTRGIRIVPAPAELVPVTYVQVWHPRYDSHPAHKWVRDSIKTIAFSLESGITSENTLRSGPTTNLKLEGGMATKRVRVHHLR